MNARHLVTCAAAAIFVMAAGCDEQKPAATGSAAPKSSAAASAVAVKSAVPAATAVATAAAAEGDLPTPADFEDAAEQEIGNDNAESTLAALEKEVEAGP
jgi:hypothetical protein